MRISDTACSLPVPLHTRSPKVEISNNHQDVRLPRGMALLLVPLRGKVMNIAVREC